MTTRRQCPRCGEVGLIRAERVIQAGKGVTELSCGACEHAWTEADEQVVSEEAQRER
jgi:hypothetical protein